jgi:hypothetical protein
MIFFKSNFGSFPVICSLVGILGLGVPVEIDGGPILVVYAQIARLHARGGGSDTAAHH